MFHEGTYEIPWYQRRYEWKKEHVIHLLQDIDDAQTNEADFYFLGSLLIIEHEQERTKWYVNDGQQRMLTYSLVCARFLRFFHDNHDEGREQMAMRALFEYDGEITKTLADAEYLTTRLIPTRDDEFRFKLIARGNGIGQNGRLTMAWQEIDKFISALSPKKACAYFDFLTEKIEVCCLRIPSNANPNMVFETLNFRGKPLDDFDLIRNYIYSFFNSELETGRRNTLKDNLDNRLRAQFVSDAAKMADYARCYLQCKYGFLRKKYFYREVKKHIEQAICSHRGKDVDYVLNLASEMAQPENSQIFLTVVKPDASTDFIRQFDREARQSGNKRGLGVLLGELQSYKVAQPLIFALLGKYVHDRIPAPMIYRHIKNLTTLVMRTALVGGSFKSSRFESNIANLACEIMKTTNKTALLKINIIERLEASAVVTSDDRFIETVKDIEINSNDKARRFLFALNANEQADSDILQLNSMTVEHVLPTSEAHWSEWKGFKDGTHKDWVHRLGNITLLSAQENKSTDKENSSFDNKRRVLKRSAVMMSKKLAENNKWTPETITKRQEEMARQAAKIWGFAYGKNSK